MQIFLVVCSFLFGSITMALKQDTGLLVVTGVFDKTGSRLLKSNTPILYKQSVTVKNNQPVLKKTRFMLIVRYVNNIRSETAFDGRISADTPGPATYGFFEIQVPVTAPVKTVSIYNNDTKKTIIQYNRIISR